MPINGPILIAKASELASDLIMEDFNCSDGRLSRLKIRNGLAFKIIFGKSADVNPNICSKYSKKLPELLSLFSPSDMFNVDETGLFNKLLPKKTLTVKNKKYTGAK